jgi:hypothetical protein
VPHTRAELLADYRKAFPEIAAAPDDELFQAIKQDHPELTKNLSDNPGYVESIVGGVGDALSNLWNGAKSLANPPDAHYTPKALEDKLPIVPRIAYNIPAGIAQSVENATAERDKAKQQGEGFAGQALAYGSQLPIIGGLIKHGEEAGPGTQYGPINVNASPEVIRGATDAVGQIEIPSAGIAGIKKGAGAAGGAIDRATSPENLQALAAKAKALKGSRAPAAVGGTAGGVIGYRVGGAPGAVGGAAIGTTIGSVAGDAVLDKVAQASEALSRYRAGAPEPVSAIPTVDPALEIQQNAAAQPVAPEATAPVERRVQSPAIQANSDRAANLMRRAEDQGIAEAPPPPTPPNGQPAGPPAPIDMAKARIGVTDEAGNHTMVAEGPSPLDGREPYVRGSVTREPVTEITGPNGEPQYPQGANGEPFQHVVTPETAASHEDILGFTPEPEAAVQPQAEPAAEPQAEVAPPQEPDFSHPIKHPPANSQLVVDNLLTRGKGAGKAQAAAINAPYLLELMPELAGVPDGPKFDGMLYNKFQEVGHALDSQMKETPGNRPVSIGNEVKELKTIADEAAKTYQGAEATAIGKLIKTLGDTGTISWDKFTEVKRTLFDKLDITTGPGRQVYDIFKDIVEGVDPKLAKLNREWFTLKTSTELADMDPGGIRKDTGELREGGGVRHAAEFKARKAAEEAAAKEAAAAAKAQKAAEAKAAKDAAAAAEKAKEDSAKADELGKTNAEKAASNAKKAAEKAASDAEKAKKAAEKKKTRDAEKAREETRRRQEKLASDAQAAKEPPNRPIRGGRL